MYLFIPEDPTGPDKTEYSFVASTVSQSMFQTGTQTSFKVTRYDNTGVRGQGSDWAIYYINLF